MRKRKPAVPHTGGLGRGDQSRRSGAFSARLLRFFSVPSFALSQDALHSQNSAIRLFNNFSITPLLDFRSCQYQQNALASSRLWPETFATKCLTVRNETPCIASVGACATEWRMASIFGTLVVPVPRTRSPSSPPSLRLVPSPGTCGCELQKPLSCNIRKRTAISPSCCKSHKRMMLT